MALDTFVPPVAQSPGTKAGYTVKKRKADFGDGYTQAYPDGANHVRLKPQLAWNDLLPEQADEIIAFLVAHAAVAPFYYALRDGVMRKWTCDVFDRTWATPYQVTATFEQYFGLET